MDRNEIFFWNIWKSRRRWRRKTNQWIWFNSWDNFFHMTNQSIGLGKKDTSSFYILSTTRLSHFNDQLFERPLLGRRKKVMNSINIVDKLVIFVNNQFFSSSIEIAWLTLLALSPEWNHFSTIFCLDWRRRTLFEMSHIDRNLVCTHCFIATD